MFIATLFTIARRRKQPKCKYREEQAEFIQVLVYTGLYEILTKQKNEDFEKSHCWDVNVILAG